MQKCELLSINHRGLIEYEVKRRTKYCTIDINTGMYGVPTLRILLLLSKSQAVHAELDLGRALCHTISSDPNRLDTLFISRRYLALGIITYR
jgi:hypothetical protein